MVVLQDLPVELLNRIGELSTEGVSGERGRSRFAAGLGERSPSPPFQLGARGSQKCPSEDGVLLTTQVGRLNLSQPEPADIGERGRKDSARIFRIMPRMAQQVEDLLVPDLLGRES